MNSPAWRRRLTGLANATMKVKEWHGDVVFLHEVAAGAADRSYGIQVARRAGLPKAVIERALEVLHHLENSSGKRGFMDDLPLFSAMRAEASAPNSKTCELEGRLAKVLPDELTPREALDLIYELKRLVKSGQ